jgi:hypothetical protein
MITVVRLPRHIATSAIAIRMAGIAISPSMKRIRMPSSQRRYPAERPHTMPKASESSAARIATMRETRVPYMTRL